MVVVASGIMQKKIKEIVLTCPEYHFTFIKQEGIKMYFSITEGKDTGSLPDEEVAAATVKKALKADAICSGLLLSVKVED